MARKGERRRAYRVWWENMKGKEYLEDLDTDGIILKWISKNEKIRVSAGMTWLKIVRSDGLLWTR